MKVYMLKSGSLILVPADAKVAFLPVDLYSEGGDAEIYVRGLRDLADQVEKAASVDKERIAMKVNEGSAIKGYFGHDVDSAVLARLRTPFGCEYVTGNPGRWRIYDANDDAIASVGSREEGFARLIVEALNAHPRFNR